MDLAATLKEIESWPLEDQIELMHRVWDRLHDVGWKPDLTEEQAAELDRRMAAAEANPHDVVTWDTIVEHVRRRR